jgi:SAM-dependent methyltransferase
LIVQAPNPQVEDALKKAYQLEGLFLTTPIDESPLTKWRADEFLHVLTDIARLNLSGKRVFEIGCSTGALLNDLRGLGADVRGCEPGPSALTARARYGLDVDQGYFQPDLYEREFDVVIHLTVLEHVVDSIEFLAQTSEVLKPGGYVFFGVPDCEPQLRVGDPGMILHEHWSYFSGESLKRTLRRAGFSEAECHSTSKGVLYGWGRWSGEANEQFRPSESGDSGASLEYFAKFDRNIRKVASWLDSARQEKVRVGLYGASVGAANLWFLLNWQGVSVELYDGERAKHGRYLPGCELAIRSPTDLLQHPPDKVLILPLSFAGAIRRFLLEELNLRETVQIDSLDDMLADVN